MQPPNLSWSREISDNLIHTLINRKSGWEKQMGGGFFAEMGKKEPVRCESFIVGHPVVLFVTSSIWPSLVVLPDIF